MIYDILLAIPFGVLLAFTIGPVFFVLLETSVTKGFKSALVFDLGVILADIVFILVIFYSTNNLLEKIKDEPNFLIFGGAILMLYGLISFIKTSQSFRAIVREHQRIEIQKDYGKLFIKGFLLNFINIGVLFGWLGFIVFASSNTTSENGILVFVITMLVTYFITDLIKIAAAKRLKNKLKPRQIFKTKKVVAIIIFACGIVLSSRGAFPDFFKKAVEKVEVYQE